MLAMDWRVCASLCQALGLCPAPGCARHGHAASILHASGRLCISGLRAALALGSGVRRWWIEVVDLRSYIFSGSSRVPRQLARHIHVRQVHAQIELAHIKEKEHDKDFYKLCTYMEPQYHQYEFDLRVYLTHMDVAGKLDWAAA